MASLRYKLETAFKAFLDAQSLGASVFTGFGSDDKTAPCVVCKLTSAEEDPMTSGNWHCLMDISVRDIASSASTHSAVADAVRNAIWTDSIASDLNGQGQAIFVHGLSAPAKIQFDTVEDCWIEIFTIELMVSDTDFS